MERVGPAGLNGDPLPHPLARCRTNSRPLQKGDEATIRVGAVKLRSDPFTEAAPRVRGDVEIRHQSSRPSNLMTRRTTSSIISSSITASELRVDRGVIPLELLGDTIEITTDKCTASAR